LDLLCYRFQPPRCLLPLPWRAPLPKFRCRRGILVDFLVAGRQRKNELFSCVGEDAGTGVVGGCLRAVVLSTSDSRCWLPRSSRRATHLAAAALCVLALGSPIISWVAVTVASAAFASVGYRVGNGPRRGPRRGGVERSR